MDKQVIIDTIKKMLDSGIEADVIAATLKDAGLGEKQARAYLAEVQGSEAEPTTEKADFFGENDLASRTAQKIKEHLAEEKAERELRETTDRAALEEHGAKIGEMNEQVSKLSGNVSEVVKQPTQRLLNEIVVLKKRLYMIEKKLDDVQAIASANKSVMEKILETDRKVLGKLK